MVGYGTLMSRQSMESTLERAYTDSIYLIHLGDFIREWNKITRIYDTTGTQKTILKYELYCIKGNDTLDFDNYLSINIMPIKDRSMNCVLYFISPEEMARFDRREKGYKRIDVTDRIVEYDFTGGRVYAFKALPQNTYRPDLDRKGSILGKAYVEKIASACDSIGTDFRKEFEESTIPYNPEMVATVIWKIVE